MTVAFAALSTNLRINGTASVPNVNWNIHFSGWALDTASTVTEGGVTHQNTAVYPSIAQLTQSLAPNVTLVEGLNITLYQPGDYAKYTFNIVNDGTIDAKLDNFTHTMTCESGKNCDFLDYTVECKDSQLNTVTQNTVLPKNGGSVSCYLQLKFKDVDNLGANTNQASNLQASVVNGVYTQEATSASLAANWAWIQNSEQQAQGGNSGGNEQGGNEPVMPTNQYSNLLTDTDRFWDDYEYGTQFYGVYGFDYAGAETSGNGGDSDWVSTLDPNVNAYVRHWFSEYYTSTYEETDVCGVFSGGTVCMQSGLESTFELDEVNYDTVPRLERQMTNVEQEEQNCYEDDYFGDGISNQCYKCPNGYDYDFEDENCRKCPDGYEDSDGMGCIGDYLATGYAGYKQAEMTAKGATCDVDENGLYCNDDYVGCSISNYSVECYNNDWQRILWFYDN